MVKPLIHIFNNLVLTLKCRCVIYHSHYLPLATPECYILHDVSSKPQLFLPHETPFSTERRRKFMPLGQLNLWINASNSILLSKITPTPPFHPCRSLQSFCVLTSISYIRLHRSTDLRNWVPMVDSLVWNFIYFLFR
jgi:hypothetical protein